MSLSDDTKLLNSWQRDPIKFLNEGLLLSKRGVSLTHQQVQGFKELGRLVNAKIHADSKPVRSGKVKMSPIVEKYSKKRGISIMSGKGPGKDAFAALAILWFFFCFPNSVIPCTAPTAPQLENVLWGELAKWSGGDPSKPDCIPPIKDDFVILRQKMLFKGHEKDKHYVSGRTANVKSTPDEQAETLSGSHEDFMMYVIDEASGIPNPVFRPIETTMTGPVNFALIIFNPTRSTGFALDTHYGNFRDQWIQLHWNSEESIRLDGTEQVSKEHIKAIGDKYGYDSDYYRINILGLPPRTSEGSLIPRIWAEKAIDRDIGDLYKNLPVILGVDVARFGDDDTAICPRQGGKVYPIETFHGLDTNEIVREVRMARFKYDADYVIIDVTGIGAGVWDTLKLDDPEVYLPFESAWSACDKYRFERLLDEVGFRLREQFQNNLVSIPPDEELLSELTSRKYDVKDNGKVKLEPKRDMKRRGLRSPNKADSLLMTYMYPDDSYLSSKDEDDEDYRSLPLPSTACVWTGY